ncbi:MAG: methyltransferase domain-containing protein [Phycisphaerae bacterium]|nr:methyltransferase domain-containing protein [Phycisphaerae bacterium]
MRPYVHGYDNIESGRLRDQADTLADLLHHDSVYPPGAHILEAGCGVGAQTIHLAGRNPHAVITSVDISADSLAQAQSAIDARGIRNVTFQQADLLHLPFETQRFDHVFVCFVLEHLPDPAQALRALLPMLKPGGTITAIEGDHGSAYYHPASEAAQRCIKCLVELQARIGGDSLIGRQLYPLLLNAGYRQVAVSPRMVYVDDSRPDLVQGFTRNTFTAMVAGVRDQALAASLIDPASWERGIADLRRTADGGGTFCYTFFKGTGVAAE